MPANLFSLFGDEGIHGEHGCLCGKNFLGENAVDFGIGVKAGVLEDDAAEVQIIGAPDGGKSDAAGGDSEEDEILNATRAEKQMKLVFRKCADPLLINDKVFRTGDGRVKFGGWSAFYEEIILPDPGEAGFAIRNFRMALRKSETDMDDKIFFAAGKFHGAACGGEDGFSNWGHAENSILNVESEQSGFFRVEFHVISR